MAFMILSTLPKTWIFDIDGTVVKHNGHLIDGDDTLLGGVREVFENIPTSDMIIFLTARKEQYRKQLEVFLRNNHLRYNHLICDVPLGERILINDEKPSGLQTAYAVNKKRDEPLTMDITYDSNK